VEVRRELCPHESCCLGLHINRYDEVIGERLEGVSENKNDF
jgi:hypothetical protein